MISLLQGKPLGHPLHPMFVHFPIGLFILSLLLDIASHLWRGSQEFFLGSIITITVGVVMGVLAALFGVADWLDIRRDHPSRKTATTHMLLNLFAVGLFEFNMILRVGQGDQEATPLGLLALSVVGVGAILYSGYLGGTMVYNDGIGAGRHRRKAPAPRKTIQVSSKEAQEGWIPVCDSSQLEDGETLRVECDGVVMAIARRGDQVYAFQEFCTHRYGPLSEGAFHDHQVECPWHRSCFDIRSGKVTEGPAKVDIKTYPSKERAGKIFIQVK